MDRQRTESPIYTRQWSSESGASSGGVSSPTMSPGRYHHSRNSSGSGISSVKRTQNFAAKAAAQRLAQVMASQAADDVDDDEDDLGFRYSAPPPIALSMKMNKPPGISSPSFGRNFSEESPATRSPSAGRPSMSLRASPLAAPNKAPPLKTAVSLPPLDPPSNRPGDKRFASDLANFNSKLGGVDQDASALRDELDMIQEEKEDNQQKLRLTEAQCEKVHHRIKELEKQVAALGEGVSLEAKLISRKEAALRQREVALKDAKQTSNGVDTEIASLRSKVEDAKGEVSVAVHQLRGAESEVKALRSMTQHKRKKKLCS